MGNFGKSSGAKRLMPYLDVSRAQCGDGGQGSIPCAGVTAGNLIGSNSGPTRTPTPTGCIWRRLPSATAHCEKGSLSVSGSSVALQVRFRTAFKSAVLCRRVPALSFEVVNAGLRVHPYNGVIRAVLLCRLLILKPLGRCGSRQCKCQKRRQQQRREFLSYSYGYSSE